MEGFAQNLIMRSYERILSFIDGTRRCIGHYKDEVFLLYLGKQCTVETTLYLPDNFFYDIDVIDIWKMTQKSFAKRVRGETKVALPGKEGIAVLARKCDF